jgi:hypothetical protein
MPIANCFIRGEVSPPTEIEGLAGLWSDESGVSDEHMTINVVAGTRQDGAAYRVMAFLYLPSLWSSQHVRRLQAGLARALCRGFGVAPSDVQVITSIVESGHVVESGQTQDW